MEETKLRLFLLPDFDKTLLPTPAVRNRDWWNDSDKTRKHAQHCLPLMMANSLGLYILSPATFEVRWTGDLKDDADIDILEAASHAQVDSHAAHGSFTIQLGFIPMTSRPGAFIFIKGIPNERAQPYSCMEALIEAWWSPASFGVVFLLNQPGTFRITKGEPVAQMFVYEEAVGKTGTEIIDHPPDEFSAWAERRCRSDYAKDLDYYRGRHPDGRTEYTHRVSWK